MHNIAIARRVCLKHAIESVNVHRQFFHDDAYNKVLYPNTEITFESFFKQNDLDTFERLVILKYAVSQCDFDNKPIITSFIHDVIENSCTLKASEIAERLNTIYWLFRCNDILNFPVFEHDIPIYYHKNDYYK